MDHTRAPDPLFLSFQSALAGRYSIDRELGRGGMGIVYLAREVHLDRLVAIKLLPPALSQKSVFRDRFLREAQLAAKLSHPNIIPIHAVQQTDEFVYYVMSFVDGETLARRVQTRGPLPASDAIRLLREVAWALQHAHAQGLVHRDVKPDNILIEAGTGRALVADFGIAAVGEAEGNGVSGTPEFMSPEQALGAETSAQSDLYSLGATAFYALSGQLPFAGSTATEVLARQVTAVAPSLTAVARHVPRKLAALIDRCLAKEPSNRPASAQAMADELGVAIEQRREMPAALRAFVKRDGRMDGAGTFISLLGALVGSVATAATVNEAAGIAVLGASLVAIPALFCVVAARRLMDMGFLQADVLPAFRAERESSREERNVQHLRKYSWRSIVETTLSRIARASAATAAVIAPFAIASQDMTRTTFLGLVAVGGFMIASLSGIAYLVLVQLRHDVDVELWSRVWSGSIGGAAFSVARKLRLGKPMVTAMTHRATELSLGMAAEQLYESLPRSSREALSELPAVMQRLQEDARLLRARGDALHDVIVHAGVDVAGEDYVLLGEERETVQVRMRETVATLERIRVGLLRLHAGSITTEGLATHVALASEMTTHLDRLIAAQDEVDDVLRASERAELTTA